MSDEKVIVTKSKLDNLANSIAAKSGAVLPLTIAQMKTAVDGITIGTNLNGLVTQDQNGYLVFEDDGEGIPASSFTVTETLDSKGGIIKTINSIDISDTTAFPQNVSSGKYFYDSNGIKRIGTRLNDPISLLATVEVPSDTRSFNLDLSNYTDYDMLLVTESVTLSSSDWLYYVLNGSEPSGGSYNDGSRTEHTGIILYSLPLGGSTKQLCGIAASTGFNGTNVTSTPITGLYIYTWTDSKTILAGSYFKIYGGNYEDIS